MNFMWSADLHARAQRDARAEQAQVNEAAASVDHRGGGAAEQLVESDHADDADQPPTSEHVFEIDAKAVRKRTLERFADEKRVFGIDPLPAHFRAELESLLPPVDASRSSTRRTTRSSSWAMCRGRSRTSSWQRSATR